MENRKKWGVCLLGLRAQLTQPYTAGLCWAGALSALLSTPVAWEELLTFNSWRGCWLRSPPGAPPDSQAGAVVRSHSRLRLCCPAFFSPLISRLFQLFYEFFRSLECRLCCVLELVLVPCREPFCTFLFLCTFPVKQELFRTCPQITASGRLNKNAPAFNRNLMVFVLS